MSGIIDFIIFVLAAVAALQAWQYGEIFAGRRAVLEVRTSFFAKLFSCAFCLSYHIPLWLFLLFILPTWVLPWSWVWVFKLPLYSLATTLLIGITKAVVDKCIINWR